MSNGPEQSRARGGCAAERTLDGEDRSERMSEEGKGAAAPNELCFGQPETHDSLLGALAPPPLGAE